MIALVLTDIKLRHKLGENLVILWHRPEPRDSHTDW